MNEKSLKKTVEWLCAGEVGTSSRTMAAVAAGVLPRHGGHPHDPGDLLRCMLLVEAVPEIRLHFGDIAAISREWAGIIDAWDELAAMLKREMSRKDRKSHETYERMQSILQEVPPCA